MFEQLFKRPHALSRQRTGPLAQERRCYLVHCAEEKMSPLTLQEIARYILVAAKALRLADRSGELITSAEIEAKADRRVKRKVHRSWIRFVGHTSRWPAFLGRLQPPAAVWGPYAEHIAQFTNFMLQERGLSPQTVEHRRNTIDKFLTQIHDVGLSLDALTVAQVDEALIRKVRDEGYSRATIQTLASTLRAFFRYAEGRGWCRSGLAAAIMAPRAFRYQSLPTGVSWDCVKKVLAAVQGDRFVYIRDRALLMLLAVYGLRAGEVVALRLEDFDWERETLTVPHGKRQKPRTYPLCRPVGDAVLRYLREVRPQSARREVFLTLPAPFRPLSREALGQATRRRLHALGMGLAHYGPHSLRHACATHLLAQGLSLKEIGDHLGHRSPDTTRIYAKVDLVALRAVADFDLEGLL